MQWINMKKKITIIMKKKFKRAKKMIWLFFIPQPFLEVVPKCTTQGWVHPRILYPPYEKTISLHEM
jgi:hypothetical protein